MLDFIPATPVLLAYLVAVAALTLTPGPDMTLFLSKTVIQGRRAGFAAFLGATTGLLIHTVLAAVGLSALLAASASAFTVLKIVGALYLVYLGIEALRHGSSFSLDRGAGAEPIHAVYLKGLAIDLLNPKVIMFFVTFLPQFVSPHDPHAAGKLLFLGLAYVVAAAPICVALILFAGRIAVWLRRSPKATRIVDYVFATIMGGFAVRLLLAERN